MLIMSDLRAGGKHVIVCVTSKRPFLPQLPAGYRARNTESDNIHVYNLFGLTQKGLSVKQSSRYSPNVNFGPNAHVSVDIEHRARMKTTEGHLFYDHLNHGL